MLQLIAKAVLAGVLITGISEIGRRLPSLGALVGSLPLVSVLGMVFLWRARPDAGNMAAFSEATFWYVLPSLPMFLLIAALLRHGLPFWVALVAGCVLTAAIYLALSHFGPRLGIRI